MQKTLPKQGWEPYQWHTNGHVSAKKTLELVSPAFTTGRVLRAPFFERIFELTQQLALVLSQLHGCLNHDVAVQVTGIAGAHALDALAAQAELLARLRAFRDIDCSLALQRRYFDLATQRRSDEAHGHLAVQIITIALKDVVFLDADFDVQIAWRPAIHAGLTIAGGANAHAV